MEQLYTQYNYIFYPGITTKKITIAYISLHVNVFF